MNTRPWSVAAVVIALLPSSLIFGQAAKSVAAIRSAATKIGDDEKIQ